MAFVFPGQGSQRVGMLDAMPALPAFDAALTEAESLSGLPLRQLALDGPAEALADTRAAQPLLYMADLVWARRAANAGAQPSVVAGHSLGELAALAFAGVYSIEHGLRLVTERARIMAEVAASVPGTMAAVLGLDRDAVADAVSAIPGVWLANDNSSAQSVISGTHQGIEAATRALSEIGARRVVLLDVAGPFHSPLMQSAQDAFSAVLDQLQFADASVPVLQNTEPTPERDGTRIKQRLRTQITQPVRWRETMAFLMSDGIDTIIETGPGAVLAGLAKRETSCTVVAAESDGIERVMEVVNA
jgi:[acyl-carrier-protein] S-malonyltransferase